MIIPEVRAEVFRRVEQHAGVYLLDDDGQPLCTATVITDISERVLYRALADNICRTKRNWRIHDIKLFKNSAKRCPISSSKLILF